MEPSCQPLPKLLDKGVGLGNKCATHCAPKGKGQGNEKRKVRSECGMVCVIANFDDQFDWVSDI